MKPLKSCSTFLAALLLASTSSLLVVGCADAGPADDDTAVSEGAATRAELAELDKVTIAELVEGATTTRIGAPSKVATLVSTFKGMKRLRNAPPCPPSRDAMRIELRDGASKTIMRTTGCSGVSLFVELPSGWHSVDKEKALAPFAEPRAVGDVVWAITETRSPDGDVMRDTGLDLDATLADANPQCSPSEGAPSLSYKRGEDTAATASLELGCAGGELSKVPARLHWGSNESAWTIVDFAKAMGLDSGGALGGLGGASD